MLLLVPEIFSLPNLIVDWEVNEEEKRTFYERLVYRSENPQNPVIKGRHTLPLPESSHHRLKRKSCLAI